MRSGYNAREHFKASWPFADGLPGRPRRDTYNSVKRDLGLLVTDITAAETAPSPEDAEVEAEAEADQGEITEPDPREVREPPAL
jgi:hypothetical protein